MRAMFCLLNDKLTRPWLLSFPGSNHPFIVKTDASKIAVGVVLARKRDDQEIHPMQFASRTMTKEERKYFTCETEVLAVILHFESFECTFYPQFHSK